MKASTLRQSSAWREVSDTSGRGVSLNVAQCWNNQWQGKIDGSAIILLQCHFVHESGKKSPGNEPDETSALILPSCGSVYPALTLFYSVIIDYDIKMYLHTLPHFIGLYVYIAVWFVCYKLKHMRSAIFWDVTQRWVVVLYRRFGTTYRFHLQGSRS
jgi:hypothetical protein